jgi:hypothetical protein
MAPVNSVVPSASFSTVPGYHPSVGNHSPPSSASPKLSMSGAQFADGEHPGTGEEIASEKP